MIVESETKVAVARISSGLQASLVRFASLRSRTLTVLYLGTFPAHSTVALTALPAMSFVPLTPLFCNDSGG
jgi:hypothetical protein